MANRMGPTAPSGDVSVIFDSPLPQRLLIAFACQEANDGSIVLPSAGEAHRHPLGDLREKCVLEMGAHPRQVLGRQRSPLQACGIADESGYLDPIAAIAAGAPTQAEHALGLFATNWRGDAGQALRNAAIY